MIYVNFTPTSFSGPETSEEGRIYSLTLTADQKRSMVVSFAGVCSS